MTHEEYLKKIREAMAKLDKTDKQAVHEFNEWRNKLYEEYENSRKG